MVAKVFSLKLKTILAAWFLFILLFVNISSSNIQEKNDVGFFTVGERNGRWCFIMPGGWSFFSTGICSIRAGGTFAPDLGYSPYYKNVMDLYGDETTWANVTHDRLVSWGFNTIGSWGDEYIISTGLPYTVNLNMAGANWEVGETVDFFSEEWINRTDRISREVCKNLSDDPNLVGYFLDNELHWGSDWRSLSDLFDTYCKFDSNTLGKKALVGFLRDRYDNNISSFNIAWRTSYCNFDEILYESAIGIWPYTTKARSDHFAFNYFVAEQYFKTCYDSIRRYDNNHLILGCRFISWLTPFGVVEACKPYVDVVSVNHYFTRPFLVPIACIFGDFMNFVRPIKLFEEFHLLTNKPILVSEFNFRAKDSGLPNTKPSPFLFPVVRTQWQRALCFEVFARSFIEKPYSVGYHWFNYADEPETGRNDGEDSNTGIVNVEDIPYEPLVSRMTIVNNLAQECVKN